MDQFTILKQTLIGKWVDQNANWMSVEEYNPPQEQKLSGILLSLNPPQDDHETQYY